MKRIKEKEGKRYRRHKKVRGKISGTLKRPRLCVFRSAQHIYAQLIDDGKGKTLASADDRKSKIVKTKSTDKTSSAKDKKEKEKLAGKQATAFEVGKLIAQKAKDLKIEKVVFDRGGYKYHGRVKALAEGARKGGLKF